MVKSLYETLYPQGNFLDIRANALNPTDYNIQATADLVRSLPGGGIKELLAPAAAATLSLPYDAIQAGMRTSEDDVMRAIESAGMYGPKDIATEAYGLAYGRERPLSTAIERTIGASAPLAERLSNSKGIPFALPNLDYRNYDLSNLFNKNQTTQPDFINAPQDDYESLYYNQLPYSGVGDMGYTTPRTIADQNRVLGQTFTEPKKSNGIMDAIMSFVMPGYNFIKNLGSGQPYERYTPGGTIRDGIYSIGGANVPVSMMNDFYNPNTGLNRFDRAGQRYEQTGSMADLFASSRTGKEFFEKRRQIQAQKQKALQDAAAAKRKFQTYTSGGGSDYSLPSKPPSSSKRSSSSSSGGGGGGGQDMGAKSKTSSPTNVGNPFGYR